MRFPKPIQKGDTIGFVAPSYGCNLPLYRTIFLNAISKLHEWGYQTELGPNCFEGSGVGISNTPQKCAAELNEYYTRKENQCLISCGGGELMCEILPYVDFRAIKEAAPKWYLGYSDNTNFTFLLSTICDTAAVYGPNAGSFGMEPWHESIYDTLAVLEGKKKSLHNYEFWEREKQKDEEHPLLPYHCTEPFCGKGYLCLPDGTWQQTKQLSVKGRLLGGCMDCLQTLVGTPYDQVKQFNQRYQKDGVLWFLEACDLNPMDIRRAMWQMKEAGWFDKVTGFLIGRPLAFGEELLSLNQYDAVLDCVKEYRVPVIMDLDIGHLPPVMPLVCGALAEADFQDQTFQITMRNQ